MNLLHVQQIDDISDEWEELVTAGIEIAQDTDRNRWLLGDIAGKVVRRYAQESLGKYAFAVNVRAATMRDYQRVSAFYQPDDRERFPTLSWSHYREAYRLGNCDHALAQLAIAADTLQSVDALRKEISEKLNPGSTDSVLLKLRGFKARVSGNELTITSDERSTLSAFAAYVSQNKPVMALIVREVNQ